MRKHALEKFNVTSANFFLLQSDLFFCPGKNLNYKTFMERNLHNWNEFEFDNLKITQF